MKCLPLVGINHLPSWLVVVILDITILIYTRSINELMNQTQARRSSTELVGQAGSVNYNKGHSGSSSSSMYIAECTSCCEKLKRAELDSAEPVQPYSDSATGAHFVISRAKYPGSSLFCIKCMSAGWGWKFIPADKSDGRLWICISQCFPRLMIFHHSNIFTSPHLFFLSFFLWPLYKHIHTIAAQIISVSMCNVHINN